MLKTAVICAVALPVSRVRRLTTVISSIVTTP